MRYNAAPEAKKLLQQKIVDRERNAREVAAQRASGILPEISSEDQQKIDMINSALERLGPLGNIGAI